MISYDNFATTERPVVLPAPCMAFDEGKRCLGAAERVIEIAGRFSTSCAEHLPASATDIRGELSPERDQARDVLLARPDWNTYFHGIAAAVARRADCTRRQVAALLITPRNRIVATGYNGPPAGVPGCLTAGACPRGRMTRSEVPTRSDYADGAGACTADHAERNAVVEFMRLMDDLGVDREVAAAMLRSCRMVVTCEPCPACYALLEAVGIEDIRWPEGTD